MTINQSIKNNRCDSMHQECKVGRARVANEPGLDKHHRACGVLKCRRKVSAYGVMAARGNSIVMRPIYFKYNQIDCQSKDNVCVMILRGDVT